jgi:hypothetical protein
MKTEMRRRAAGIGRGKATVDLRERKAVVSGGAESLGDTIAALGAAQRTLGTLSTALSQAINSLGETVRNVQRNL